MTNPQSLIIFCIFLRKKLLIIFFEPENVISSAYLVYIKFNFLAYVDNRLSNLYAAILEITGLVQAP